MVKLADTSNANVDEKTSAPDNTDDINSVLQEHRRPSWIKTTTCQPIYNIVNSKVTNVKNSPSGTLSDKVVAINTIDKRLNGKSKSEVSRDKQRELPYVWLSSRNTDSLTSKVEDEDTLYNVVRKPKKVQSRETVSTNIGQLAIQSVDQDQIENIDPQGGRLQLNDTECTEILKRAEVRKWYRDTPKRSLSPVMYTDHQLGYEEQWQRENPSVTLSRGLVGLVGPYRVHNSPIQRSEYVLQEEELIEETVDSVNGEKVQVNNKRQEEHHRQRAKWRIREENDNNEETLASDIRDLSDIQSQMAARKLNGKRINTNTRISVLIQ